MEIVALGHQWAINQFTMKPRRTYTPIRIDFTPFVSVALLLIVFFMWVKMTQRLNQMAFSVPDKINRDTVEIDGCNFNSTLLTLYLVGNHKILYSFGQLSQQSELRRADFHSGDLRKTLLYVSKNGDGLIVVIKPTRLSIFADMVNILDEMTIVKIKRYVLIDSLTPSEQSLITKCSPNYQ